MVTTHRINTCFLEDLSQDEKKAFVLVLKIKNKFVSSYVKDYRISRLANQLNLSRYFVDKYMKIILEKGWGICVNNNIQISSFKTIYYDFDYQKKSGKNIKVCFDSSANTLLDELNFMILQKNLEEQEYRAKPKRIHTCLNNQRYVKLSKSEYRWYGRLLKNNRNTLDGELVSNGVLGMRRLSELLKCSVNSAISFLKRMESRGLVCLRHIKRVFNDKQDFTFGIDNFVSNRIGYFYESRGKLYQFVGTEIKLNFSILDRQKYRTDKIRYKNNVNQAEFVQFSTLSIVS